MGTIEKIYEYQEGIEFTLFPMVGEGDIFYDNPNRKKLISLKNCPLNGQSINFVEPTENEDYDSIYESFNHNIPSPCNSCACLNLANDAEEDYGVVGICKRYCEFDPKKVTLLRWM